MNIPETIDTEISKMSKTLVNSLNEANKYCNVIHNKTVHIVFIKEIDREENPRWRRYVINLHER